MIRVSIFISILFFLHCADNRSYTEARKIAITQYTLSCTGGSYNSCRMSCDSKCGIDSNPINSVKLDCAKNCLDDCNRNCNTILLFLLNTKND
ncbi:MAG TPA: hypothetical protein PKL30_13340 [Leptospiraceae bacterium]|nr:hypothetical protein [Leptospiraceae bacterium]HMY32722.1 hypothetical protein [Leptospiraceae bacterium]HNA05762.1 hypothetical protein [Leptospiraceae bacterium]HNF55327.1 hypothetical protein [Leptospiraceae bacterium]HNL72137.1 hypothetical protein [Leptospiraceae bacterium]